METRTLFGKKTLKNSKITKVKHTEFVVDFECCSLDLISITNELDDSFTACDIQLCVIGGGATEFANLVVRDAVSDG